MNRFGVGVDVNVRGTPRRKLPSSVPRWGSGHLRENVLSRSGWDQGQNRGVPISRSVHGGVARMHMADRGPSVSGDQIVRARGHPSGATRTIGGPQRIQSSEGSKNGPLLSQPRRPEGRKGARVSVVNELWARQDR